MMRRAGRILVLLLPVLLLGACATSGSSSVGKVWPAPPSSTPAPQPNQPPPPEAPGTPTIPTPIEPVKPTPPSYPSDPAAISGQAVVSLMEQASQARADGKLDVAAANLERAVRIEPRNYFVWSALASVYLAQGQAEQAERVAQKSNSLARGNPHVELVNWRLIANCRQAQGDATGALQAQAEADEVERTLVSGTDSVN